MNKTEEKYLRYAEEALKKMRQDRDATEREIAMLNRRLEAINAAIRVEEENIAQRRRRLQKI